jgi:hypothetical protein
MLKSQQLGGGIPLRMPFSPERNFNYVRPIRITNRTDAFTDIPIELNLTENNFDFTVPKLDGSDIRFKNANRKLLAYWIESWDVSAKTATVWVWVPEMDAHEERIVWMFFDNPNAISQSSIDNKYNRGLLQNYSFETTITPSDWTWACTGSNPALFQLQTDWKTYGNYSIKLRAYIIGGSAHAAYAYISQDVEGPIEMLVDLKTGTLDAYSNAYAKIYYDGDLLWSTTSQNTEFLDQLFTLTDSGSHTLKFQCGVGGGGPNRYSYLSIDNIRLKKHIDPEPLVTFL